MFAAHLLRFQAALVVCYVASVCGLQADFLLLNTTTAESQESPVATAVAQARTFTVTLGKQDVPVVINGREVAKKTAYFGTVFLGLPVAQNFTVVFDTGSGHLFVPSAECNDEPCKLHKTYSRHLSRSAKLINHDGTVQIGNPSRHDRISISYGTGDIVGDFVREVVCVNVPAAVNVGARGMEELKTNSPHCTTVRVITAMEMTSDPFSMFEFDGVLGLGLEGLALDPEFHFFGQMARNNHIEPVFSFFLSKYDEIPSEITFGGHDAKRMSGPLHWVPVASPEQGYWRVLILGIRIGNESIPFCDDGSCSAIVDTGTSLLGVPPASLDTLLWKTAREAPEGVGRDFDCRSVPGPPIIFDVAGGYEVHVEADGYTRRAPTEVPDETGLKAQSACRASLLPIEMPTLGKNVFIWGAPVLKRHYTSYDSAKQLVGFAPAVQKRPSTSVVV